MANISSDEFVIRSRPPSAFLFLICPPTEYSVLKNTSCSPNTLLVFHFLQLTNFVIYLARFSYFERSLFIFLVSRPLRDSRVNSL